MKKRNREYLKLVARVMDIDKEAAKYMLTEAVKLESFDTEGYLIGCFIWEDTEQGHEFWSNINYKLQ